MTLLLPALIKALSTALVVVICAVLAEAFGPFWGALIASLPIVAGPTYLFLALDHSDSFIASAALGGVATVPAIVAFLMVYALVGQRLRMLPSLAIGLGGWAAAVAVIRQIDWTVARALGFNALAFALAALAMRHITLQSDTAPRRSGGNRWFDLSLRATLIAGFVLLSVSVADWLGPRATGIFSLFPIAMTSLILLVRPRIGGPASVKVALVAVQGMVGLACFLLTLHLCAPRLGSHPALLAGLLASLAWSGVMLLWRRR